MQEISRISIMYVNLMKINSCTLMWRIPCSVSNPTMPFNIGKKERIIQLGKGTGQIYKDITVHGNWTSNWRKYRHTVTICKIRLKTIIKLNKMIIFRFINQCQYPLLNCDDSNETNWGHMLIVSTCPLPKTRPDVHMILLPVSCLSGTKTSFCFFSQHWNKKQTLIMQSIHMTHSKE